MRRIIQKKKTALKILATTGELNETEEFDYSPEESDMIFSSLEYCFKQVLSNIKSGIEASKIENDVTSMWQYSLKIRKNEQTLKDMLNKFRGKSTKNVHSLSLRAVVDHKLMQHKRESTDDTLQEFQSEFSNENEMNIENTANQEILEELNKQLVSELGKLRDKLNITHSAMDKLKEEYEILQQQNIKITNDLENQATETAKESKFRLHFEEKVKGMMKEIQNKERENEDINATLRNAKEQIKILQITTNEQKLTNELLSQNNAHLVQRTLKLQTDFNAQTSTLEELTTKCSSLISEIKVYEENAGKMSTEIGKINKQKEIWQKRIQNVESQKKELQTENEKLLKNTNNLEKELEATKKSYENERKNLQDLKREKELLAKNYHKATVTTEEQNRILKIELRMKEQLENQVQSLHKEYSKTSDTVASLDKEKDRLKTKNIEYMAKIENLHENITEKDSEISELKKQLNDLDIAYRHQANLLQNTKNDKNMFSKNLMQSKEEIMELKERIKMLTQQIENGKYDITNKDTQILKERSTIQRLEQDKEKLYEEIGLRKESINYLKKENADLIEKEKTLTQLVHKLESEIQRKDKQIKQMTMQQELTATQILQKHEETSFLNAKVKSLQSEKEQRDNDIKTQLNDLQALKIENKQLKNERASLSRSLGNVANLRAELFQAERELTRERVKTRALEEELRNPVNIHRWRKLEGTDPDTYSLIIKMRMLQKRSLSQSEKVVEKEEQLRELESLYGNLKATVSKHPTTQLANKLHFLRKQAEQKDKKIKVLLAEMSMYEAQASECKFEVNQKNKEVEKVKKEFNKQKEYISKLKKKIACHVCVQEISNEKPGPFEEIIIAERPATFPAIQTYS